MSSDFAQLIADIEREAHEEGPRAIRELEQLREEFADSFSQAQRAIANGDIAGLAAIASRTSRRRARVAVDCHGDL